MMNLVIMTLDGRSFYDVRLPNTRFKIVRSSFYLRLSNTVAVTALVLCCLGIFPAAPRDYFCNNLYSSFFTQSHFSEGEGKLSFK